MLDEQQVKHVARLARLKLKDAEVKKLSKELTDVLEYMDILNEVDTSKVSGTNQVTGLTNVMQEDKIEEKRATREELLNTSELEIDSNQIRVQKTIKND
jgi:aspartyl-tRNA(Asn)/glutamyl-tRNA(Gln) amidotransferase subunit C